jgi:hypothetical protein
MKRHPAIDAFVVVDTDTIRLTGVEADKKLVSWIRFLKVNGAKVLGRVDTKFAIPDIVIPYLDQVQKWKKHYPDIDGIYLDNVAQHQRTTSLFYNPLVEGIRELGHRYVVGTVGTAQELINTTPANVEALVRDAGFDILILYEGKNFPNPATFAQGWMQKYPRSKLGVIITGVGADENEQAMQDFVMQLVGTYKAAGYVYVNTDSGARIDNPYTNLSSMFEVQLRTMDRLAAAEGNVIRRATDTPGVESVFGSNRNIQVPTSQGMMSVQDIEKDVNGIRKIYPDSKTNYQEWYFNERDPFKDPQLKDEEGSNLRRMQDGSNSFYIDGGKKGQVRIAGWSKPGTYWADATEMTIYMKWLNDLKGKKTGAYLAQIYLRGGDHSTQKGRGGEASCYKLRVKTTGQFYLVKEIQHSPPGYTKNMNGKNIRDLLPKKTLKGQWLGMKLVVYNIQEKDGGPIWVRIEGWADYTCTIKDGGKLDTSKQKWVKVAEYIDKGGWRCSDMKKPVKWPSVDYNSKTPTVRQPTEIISKPGGTKEGNLGAYRTDNRATCFKYFCIRQIQNPSHAD